MYYRYPLADVPVIVMLIVVPILQGFIDVETIKSSIIYFCFTLSNIGNKFTF